MFPGEFDTTRAVRNAASSPTERPAGSAAHLPARRQQHILLPALVYRPARGATSREAVHSSATAPVPSSRPLNPQKSNSRSQQSSSATRSLWFRTTRGELLLPQFVSSGHSRYHPTQINTLRLEYPHERTCFWLAGVCLCGELGAVFGLGGSRFPMGAGRRLAAVSRSELQWGDDFVGPVAGRVQLRAQDALAGPVGGWGLVPDCLARAGVRHGDGRRTAQARGHGVRRRRRSSPLAAGVRGWKAAPHHSSQQPRQFHSRHRW